MNFEFKLSSALTLVFEYINRHAWFLKLRWLFYGSLICLVLARPFSLPIFIVGHPVPWEQVEIIESVNRYLNMVDPTVSTARLISGKFLPEQCAHSRYFGGQYGNVCAIAGTQPRVTDKASLEKSIAMLLLVSQLVDFDCSKISAIEMSSAKICEIRKSLNGWSLNVGVIVASVKFNFN